MSKVGAGKPVVQSAIVQQPPEAMARQLLAFGNSAQSYSAVQTGPGELMFTRTFWPVSYIVIAVVGFIFCLIGPLILLMNQTEMLTIRLRPGPRPGSTEISVNGVADPQMMGWLMALLGQGEFIDQARGAAGALTGPGPADVQMSPDGAYWWDGSAWRDTTTSAPPNAPRSPDGRHWWDGGTWRPIGSQPRVGASDPTGPGASTPPSDDVASPQYEAP